MTKKKLLFEFRESIRNLSNTLLSKEHTLHYKHQAEELLKFKQFFDEVESHPLTKSQRKAIILNEKRNLIIAGAGSGKTSVLVGKCGYLLNKGLASEDEILLLAYNKDAATELEQRIKRTLNAEVKVKTFHALGLEIIDSIQENKPAISNILIQRKESLDFFDDFLLQTLKKTKVHSSLSQYMATYTVPYLDEFKEFKSLKEYKNWVTRSNLITLQGEQVKSYGEFIIANFLYTYGINYKYEASYKPNHGNLKDRYTPDFHLTDINAYIEYYGLDREGNTAPYIDKDKYNAEIQWKENIHQTHGTKLIDLYYYNLKEGDLELKLQRSLEEVGLKFRKKSDEEILQSAVEAQYTSKLFNILKTFLGHFKSNQLTIEQLKAKYSSNHRNSLFLDIFEFFYYLYSSKLEELKAIDFDDMILLSTKVVKDKKYLSSFKYILVDEYQDISMSRFKLIMSLLDQNPETSLFCVGDDWQSIYRFSGSDVGLMTNFRHYLGDSTTIEKLDLTFRYNKSLAEVSGSFIQRNRNQIKKDLKTFDIAETNNIKVHFRTTLSGGVLDAVSAILERYNIRSDHRIFILARYTQNLPDHNLLSKLRDIWPGSIETLTCHGSKGLETDFVIVCDLISNDLGFPSEVADDPVLNMVLNEKEHFPNEEERRLFYVALTRAKKEVHLLTTYSNPSIFIEEIKDNVNVEVIEYQNSLKTKCHVCDSGEIVESASGFLYCSNRPLCEYSPPKCPECKEGQINLAPSSQLACTNQGCDYMPTKCSKCSSGIMVERLGKHGPFFGCSNYPNCTNTSNSI
tara:strand:+ start:206 stop:2596 length:2391 start_codon:yes stop_codon:yes gene_type:complete